MSIRLASLLLILLAMPLSGQRSTRSERAGQRIESRNQATKPESSTELDQQKVRLATINHDAADLSSLTVSLQSDLQQLQKGMLARDLDQKLKKIEKLSKKLRQEMAQ
jgi:hypothetical protein